MHGTGMEPFLAKEHQERNRMDPFANKKTKNGTEREWNDWGKKGMRT